jgi:hypothetical protein
VTAEDAVAAGYGVLAEGVDGADVGGEDEEGDEDGLGGDAADATTLGVAESGVGAAFGDAVEAFDGVAQGVVRGFSYRQARPLGARSSLW